MSSRRSRPMPVAASRPTTRKITQIVSSTCVSMLATLGTRAYEIIHVPARRDFSSLGALVSVDDVTTRSTRERRRRVRTAAEREREKERERERDDFPYAHTASCALRMERVCVEKARGARLLRRSKPGSVSESVRVATKIDARYRQREGERATRRDVYTTSHPVSVFRARARAREDRARAGVRALARARGGAASGAGARRGGRGV